MTGRTFLIQRYCSDMHPHVMGLRPFIVSGPCFDDWVVPGSLGRTGQHLLRRSIRSMLISLFPPGGVHQRQYQHAAAAEALLRERVIMALWSTDSPDCLSPNDRWSEAITQVKRELPFRHPISFPPDDGYWEIETAVSEYLSGMPSPAMAREYLIEDQMRLEAMDVPEFLRGRSQADVL